MQGICTRFPLVKMSEQKPISELLATSARTLSFVPIIEVALDIRAKSTRVWVEDELISTLRSELPGYSFLDSIFEFQSDFELPSGESGSVNPIEKSKTIWRGVRFKSDDGKNICCFSLDGVVFSRLMPYLGWDHFISEASKVVHLLMSQFQPESFDRVGLRTINKIPLDGYQFDLKDWLRFPPTIPFPTASPKLLSIGPFIHKEVIYVHEGKYGVNLLKAVHGDLVSNRVGEECPALTIDIDVMRPEVVNANLAAQLLADLDEMRVIKNFFFFNSIGRFIS